MVERRRIHVQGVVQGIGFRPFVYRLAHEAAVTGWIRNDGSGVRIEVQGATGELDALAVRLERELPPGGRLDKVVTESLTVVERERGFSIVESAPSGDQRVSIAPDRFVCADCLRELGDGDDRRHRYPFINCTACGPRYSIAIELPYDRPSTTMASFVMCADCRREYQDPLDRRYHAEPIACPVCGPTVWLAAPGGNPAVDCLRPADPAAPVAIAEAIAALEAGRVVAIKGIGGFHLACDGHSARAVSRLRALKRRPRKPLAVMVRDLATARRLVVLDESAEALLRSPAAPIVLTPRRPRSGLAAEVAPHLHDLGVMLPYSPLHHLLFEGRFDALVMTSGNHPSEPITIDNREALERLPADLFVLHDRDIHVAVDDSVVRASDQGLLSIRRARGFVPGPLPADHLPRRSVLALGAQLKVTVTTLRGGELIVGRHLGDLDNPRAEAAFAAEVERMLRFGRVEPETVAVDLHPDLASTLFAEEHYGHLPLQRIQHHHAHLAAVLAEHRAEPDSVAIGIVLDGFGYGTDGAIWGGEVLRGGYRSFERVAHLRYVAQPGGDRAALEPRRMATSHLLDADLGGVGVAAFEERFASICAARAVSPWTSSAGRLFDAAAAILGVAPVEQDYEGEAAMRLEAAADAGCSDGYGLPMVQQTLDTRVLVRELVRDRAPTAVRAARFHNGLADGLAAAALRAGPEPVVLAGGCLANRLLLRRLRFRLAQAGRAVLMPRELPAGDGGLSVGQAASAACMLDDGGNRPCA